MGLAVHPGGRGRVDKDGELTLSLLRDYVLMKVDREGGRRTVLVWLLVMGVRPESNPPSVSVHGSANVD